jgi:hypothetical protein
LRAPSNLLAGGAAVAATLCIVPAAQAATVATPAQCVRIVPGVQSFPVQASGFTPNSSITFTSDGQFLGSGTADAAGNFDNSQPGGTLFDPPLLPQNKNTTTVQLAATDSAGLAAPAVPVPVSRVVVTAPSNVKPPTKKVRFRVFGFLVGKKVYLHIRRHGKTLGRFSLGRTKGPCGLTSKRMRFMPLKHYKTGNYQYYFSHSKKFSKSKVIFGGRVSITRTFKAFRQAAAGAVWR